MGSFHGAACRTFVSDHGMAAGQGPQPTPCRGDTKQLLAASMNPISPFGYDLPRLSAGDARLCDMTETS